MIYLKDNPLLREPLRPSTSSTPARTLGREPGPVLCMGASEPRDRQARLDIDLRGRARTRRAGRARPGYLEGTYSEIYPDKSEDAEGLRKFFKQFSFPGHIGSHVHAGNAGLDSRRRRAGLQPVARVRAAFDNPDLIVACVVGDGEAETGPLATAWHSNKFLNPIRDGAVLPILNLNGYKIANPTILARISHEELEVAVRRLWLHAVLRRRQRPGSHASEDGRDAGRGDRRDPRDPDRGRANRTTPSRPRWPMIVLRSPKGWTGPKEIKGHKVEGLLARRIRCRSPTFATTRRI